MFDMSLGQRNSNSRIILPLENQSFVSWFVHNQPFFCEQRLTHVPSGGTCFNMFNLPCLVVRHLRIPRTLDSSWLYFESIFSHRRSTGETLRFTRFVSAE